MRVLDRLFLFFQSVIFFVVSLFMFLVSIRFFKYGLLSDAVYSIYSNSNLQWTIAVTSLVTTILSLYFMIKSFQTNRAESFFNKSSELGEIRISMETLENMASKTALKVNGVKDLKVRIRPEENATVTGIVKIFVDGETPIPKISEEIQQSIKHHIEEIAGIEVGHVHIIVSNIGQSNHVKKARVE